MLLEAVKTGSAPTNLLHFAKRTIRSRRDALNRRLSTKYGLAMSAPPSPPNTTRLRRLPVIIAIAVLVGVGLAPIDPSSSQALVIAVAGLTVLGVSWLVGPPLVSISVFGAGLVMYLVLFWFVLAKEAVRAIGKPEPAKAEVDAAFERVDADLRDKVRAKVSGYDADFQLAYVRAVLNVSKRVKRPVRAQFDAIEFAEASLAALAGLAFLLFWTFVYLLIWSCQSAAFSDLGETPRLGEFLFISASGVFGGTPEGVQALSAWSQTAMTVQLLSAAVLIGALVAALRTSSAH